MLNISVDEYNRQLESSVPVVNSECVVSFCPETLFEFRRVSLQLCGNCYPRRCWFARIELSDSRAWVLETTFVTNGLAPQSARTFCWHTRVFANCHFSDLR